jgi:rhodanese-related sulfurtransferase
MTCLSRNSSRVFRGTVLALFALCFSRAVSAPLSTPLVFSIDELRAVMERRDAVVIDVRPDLHYRRGHVPGALSLPATRFQAGYSKLKARLESDKAQLLVLYCGGGQCDESEQVRGRLRAMGFTRVAIVPEGWAGWQAARLPEEKAEGVDAPLEPWKGSPRANEPASAAAVPKIP